MLLASLFISRAILSYAAAHTSTTKRFRFNVCVKIFGLHFLSFVIFFVSVNFDFIRACNTLHPSNYTISIIDGPLVILYINLNEFKLNIILSI